VRGRGCAPNDLVVGPDGTVYFTDPWPIIEPAAEPSSRVMAYETDGTLRVVADGFVFCNGIAIDGDGHLVVTEANGRESLGLACEADALAHRGGPGR
jgi:gluconolactonase